ncbi:MAG: hypothetical protein JWO56_2756 [Acidobacteria bacterium]|nr:hypothetical protein [Acidobacteriota bacterium]
MRKLLLSLFLLLITPALFGAGWKKAYFGATPPGSWARYDDSAPQMKMTTTMTRLSDDDGSARIDLNVAFANDQYPPVRNRYTLKHGFPLDRRLIDYMNEVEGGSIVSGEGEPTVLDAATVAAIVRSSPQLEPFATFKGTETVGGKQADRYGYTLHHEGSPATIETGDVWLSAAVPFGLVKQSSVTKDGHGKVTTTYERLLVASGTKSPAASAEPAKTARAAPKKTSHTLGEAYAAGLVDVSVTIVAGSRNGERAHLVIEKKDDERMTLIIPKGKTSLHVDIPLEDFVFELPAEKTFELGGNKAAELDVKQLGEQRAMDGHFKISTYEGTPLFSGSATVGWVKK